MKYTVIHENCKKSDVYDSVSGGDIEKGWQKQQLKVEFLISYDCLILTRLFVHNIC